MVGPKMFPKPRAVILAGLVVFAVLGPACEERRQPPPISPEQAKAQYVYTVRGEIVSLPRPDAPASALMIRHEPIAEFANRDGEIVGMATMVMEFPPAEGLSLEGLAPGDKVEVVWEVWMQPRMRSQTTRITKLPPDTELQFGR